MVSICCQDVICSLFDTELTETFLYHHVFDTTGGGTKVRERIFDGKFILCFLNMSELSATLLLCMRSIDIGHITQFQNSSCI